MPQGHPSGLNLPTDEQRADIIAQDDPIMHCGQQMEVTRTKTSRTNRCKKCSAWWKVDVSSLIPSMFGAEFIVSDQVPSVSKKQEG